MMEISKMSAHTMHQYLRKNKNKNKNKTKKTKKTKKKKGRKIN